MLDRLTMRAHRRRLLGGRGRVPQDGFGVRGRVPVVGEPRRVRGAERRCLERLDRAPVQDERAIRRQRLLDRQPGQLVPESDARRILGQHHRVTEIVIEHDRPDPEPAAAGRPSC